MFWNCFIVVCGIVEVCVLRFVMAVDIEILRVFIIVVWFVELGIFRFGVFSSWYRWFCWGGIERWRFGVGSFCLMKILFIFGVAVWCELNILVNSGRVWVGVGGGVVVLFWWLKMVIGFVLIWVTYGFWDL